MKIVVIGGSGLIGTKLVHKLRERGHEVVAASPTSGVNTITGEELAEALAGTQVVVDVHARSFGAELNDHSLVPGDHPRLAPTRFEDWLSRSRPQ
jgi:uncharacterized protein YbjT (DUF2867 family)